MTDLENRFTRQETIKLAILYAVGKNDNVPSQVRRILKQQFNIDVLACEVECEQSILVSESLPKLLHLAPKVA